MFRSDEIEKIRSYWSQKPNLIGYTDAEKDSVFWRKWEDSVFYPSDTFQKIGRLQSLLVVGRKGSGKSAAKIAAERASGRGIPPNQVCISVSADSLVDSAMNDFEIRRKAGASAVAVWYQIFAVEILKSIAQSLTGRALVDSSLVQLRQWALSQGFVPKDFGERLVEGARTIFPAVRKSTRDPQQKRSLDDSVMNELLRSSRIHLFVDDFDNTENADTAERIGVRNVQSAIEAADRLNATFNIPNVSLLIREDLWLRCRQDWHYLDKVTNPTWLLWEAQDLKRFLKLRLAEACSQALEEHVSSRHGEMFETLWSIFFPETIGLEDGQASMGFTYVLRRTMYTPRDIQTFLSIAISNSRGFPLAEAEIHKAEERFSTERLQYLINEFGTMCRGLAQCLHSFAGHSLQWTTSDLRKHLAGQIGNGGVSLRSQEDGAENAVVALMRFLFRIGFLEVRMPRDHGDRDGAYEVRDGLRHPDHWRGARVDDSVRWAVRSTFFQALKFFGAKRSRGEGRKR